MTVKSSYKYVDAILPISVYDRPAELAPGGNASCTSGISRFVSESVRIGKIMEYMQ